MTVARLLCVLAAPIALTLVSAVAPVVADVPTVGQPWAVPAMKTWLDTAPAAEDAAGKVTIHWFCKPKLEACRDDLARIFNMREQSNRVYVVAYINGTARDAKALDPVRGDVGAGATAYGKPVAAFMKSMGIGPSALPMAIVVGTDGKVATFTTTGDPEVLDQRDAKIAALIGDIHEYVLGSWSPKMSVKVGQPFELGLKIELASWLRFPAERPALLTLTPPPDVTCDATKVGPEKMRIVGTTLEASVRCQAAVKGSYEARGTIRFTFGGPRNSVGVGDDAVVWKFEVRADAATPPVRPTPPPVKPAVGKPAPTKPAPIKP